MKNGKKPTTAQRKFISGHNLDSTKWFVVKWTPTEVVLIHKKTGEPMTFKL